MSFFEGPYVPTWFVEPDNPPYVGWLVVVGCIKKSSVRKVTRSSMILAFRGFTSEFPRDPFRSSHLVKRSH